MANTAVFTHPACHGHHNDVAHPEGPERLKAVLDALQEPPFAALAWYEAPEATVEQIGRVHDPRFVQALLAAVPKQGYLRIDEDTAMNKFSGEAMLRAAGAAVAAVDAVMAGEIRNAFCAVRPPGHHAERAKPMGFCFFNNVAIGAMQARAEHNLTRVAVVDFDVHHGNGTQAMFWNDPNLFYASTHQSPLFPHTGGADESGVFGNVVNVPLAPEAGGGAFRRAYTETILPKLAAFAPEFVLLSAGFDGHYLDPLARLGLQVEDFAWVTRELCGLAARHAQGRVVSVLEGGYDTDALAASAQAHVLALMAADE